MSGAGGYELLEAYAEIFSRVSLAIGRFEIDSYILSAGGPARARVVAAFSRPTVNAGAVTIKKGTICRASSRGNLFRLIEDVAFTDADLGPIDGTVEAIGYGESWNIDGEWIAPDGTTLPGELDEILLPLLDPPFGDRSIVVTNVEGPTVDGHSPTLDLHGAERDTRRLPAETDERYAERIRAVPDVVTPVSIRRRVDRFMSALGYTDADWYLVETTDHRFQEVYDAPELEFTYAPHYSAELFSYDDSRTASPVRNRMLDEQFVEGAFVLEVPQFPCVTDAGFAYDDQGEELAEFATDLGWRAHSAYDISDGAADSIHECAYDGVDIGHRRLVLDLADMLNSAKAHGVAVAVFAKGD